MKSSLSILLLAVLCAKASGFSGSSSFAGSSMTFTQTRTGNQLIMEYIPSGMSKEQWLKIKEAEKNKNKGKDLGKVGITTFKSRSFADWQKSGGKNLFPVDPKKVKDPKQIPYMQRPGGAPDDSDLKPKSPFSFSAGKKKEEEPKQETKKSVNWWTLN